MTIGEKLDKLFPAGCLACGTLYKRAEAKWSNGASRNVCSACGLDQTSAEAGHIAKAKAKAVLKAGLIRRARRLKK